MNFHNFNLHELEEDEYYSNSFFANLVYSMLYHPNGVTRPSVWLGKFSKFDLSQYQKRLFDVLKKEQGFKRTPLQIVFPEQNAGLIKRLSDEDRSVYSLDENIDEAHIRFYLDGAIYCELEPNRFNTEHYAYGIDGTDYLEGLVNSSRSLTASEKNQIISQIEPRDLRETCTATIDNPLFQQFVRDIKTCNFITDCWILSVVKNVVWAGASVGAYIFYDKIFELLYENTTFFEMLVK